jgi:hypothetical protein
VQKGDGVIATTTFFDIIEISGRYSLTNIGFRDKISQIFDNSVIRGYRSILERVRLRQGDW